MACGERFHVRDNMLRYSSLHPVRELNARHRATSAIQHNTLSSSALVHEKPCTDSLSNTILFRDVRTLVSTVEV